MKEIVSLFYNILFIPIPLPISFNNAVMYYNLMGIIVVFFLIFLVSLIIRKISGGAGD